MASLRNLGFYRPHSEQGLGVHFPSSGGGSTAVLVSPEGRQPGDTGVWRDSITVSAGGLRRTDEPAGGAVRCGVQPMRSGAKFLMGEFYKFLSAA